MEVVEPDGRVRKAGAGLNALAERLPGVRWAARLPLEGPYQLVARNRGWLSRFVPNRAPTVRP